MGACSKPGSRLADPGLVGDHQLSWVRWSKGCETPALSRLERPARLHPLPRGQQSPCARQWHSRLPLKSLELWMLPGELNRVAESNCARNSRCRASSCNGTINVHVVQWRVVGLDGTEFWGILAELPGSQTLSSHGPENPDEKEIALSFEKVGTALGPWTSGGTETKRKIGFSSRTSSVGRSGAVLAVSWERANFNSLTN